MGDIIYENVVNTVEECGNMGGIGTKVYAAPLSFFKSLALKKDCSVDRHFDGINLFSEGVDELLPGKALFEVYSTMEKGSLISEGQGEVDGMSHKINLKLYTPGLTSKGLAIRNIPNQSWIFYVKTGTQMFRVGNKMYPAKMAPDGQAGTGDAVASAKGNEMNFFSYEQGPAGEVVDIAAVEAMLNAVDESLTVVFDPADGDKGEVVTVTPSITFSESVKSADTGLTLTPAELAEFISLKKVDFNGDYAGDVSFSAAIATDTVITITPDANLELDETYEVKFDNSKILSSAEQGRVNGVNFARFGTADV